MGASCCGNNAPNSVEEEKEIDGGITVEWLKNKAICNQNYLFVSQSTFELFINRYLRKELNSEYIAGDLALVLYKYANISFGNSYIIERHNCMVTNKPLTIASLNISKGCSLTVNKWNDKANSMGSIQIEANKTIEIHGTITTYAKGYGRWHYGVGKGGFATYRFPRASDSDYCGAGGGYATQGTGFSKWPTTAQYPKTVKGGSVYGEHKLKTLYYGSPGGLVGIYSAVCEGGGIIELIAENVINYGVVNSNGGRHGGSGGSIKITCKYFENYGDIVSKGGTDSYSSNDCDNGSGGDGRICIRCEQFVNQGQIEPKPYVDLKYKYTSNSDIDFTVIEDAPKKGDKQKISANQIGFRKL